ncbi:MAG TPA: choice-of-anchor J domain-containing protein, partial [Humisphaera sp.]
MSRGVLASVVLLSVLGCCCAELAGAVVRFETDFATPAALNGWTVVNNSDAAAAGWTYGGMTNMSSRGGGNDFIAVGFDAVGPHAGTATASAWLISPVVELRPGDELRYWSRGQYDVDSPFPDRMQIRLNPHNAGTNVGTSPASVGDFDVLLADVNPTYRTYPAAGAYPIDWTEYRLVVPAGVDTAAGRFAFRYLIEDIDANGYEVGVDDVRLTAVPEPAGAAAAGSL